MWKEKIKYFKSEKISRYHFQHRTYRSNDGINEII
jgi:hypothetical protein